MNLIVDKSMVTFSETQPQALFEVANLLVIITKRPNISKRQPQLVRATRLRSISCDPVYRVSYDLPAQSQDLQARFQSDSGI